MLSEPQEWVLRFLVERGRPASAQRVGEHMLRRPGFDPTGKTYSSFTLGRMGGGVLAHLEAKALVRIRKIRGKTVASATRGGQAVYRDVAGEQPEPEFFDLFFAPEDSGRGFNVMERKAESAPKRSFREWEANH